MIIGEYAVNPLQIFYGKKSFVAGANTYTIEIHVVSDEEIPETLVQYVVKNDDADAMLKLIDQCIAIRKEAQLDGTLHGDNYDYEE